MPREVEQPAPTIVQSGAGVAHGTIEAISGDPYMAGPSTDAIIASLLRLEKGQSRVESQLLQIEKRLSHGDKGPFDISSTSEDSQSAMPSASAAKEASSPTDDVGNAPSVENQPRHHHHERQVLDEVLAQQDEESVAKSKAEFMSKQYQEMLKEQEAAQQELFRAHNQAKGWLTDEEEEEPLSVSAAQVASNASSNRLKLWLAQLMDSGHFDMAFGAVIFLNALVMFYKIEAMGQRIGFEQNFSHKEPLQFVKAEPPIYTIADSTVSVVEICFVAVFTLELVTRLWVRGRRFFANGWNILDTILVGVAYIELAFTSIPIDLTIFRMLRLVRLTRVLRVIRVMRSFRSLRVLVRTAFNSFLAIVWSVMLLGLILLMGACLMGALLIPTTEDDSIDYSLRQEVWRTWGTTGHAFNTLFRWTLTTSWTSDIDILMLGIGPMFGLFIYPFILLINFTLVRVVSAVFIKETFNAAQKDTDEVLEETMRKGGKAIGDLKRILKEFGEDGSGNLTRAGFEKALLDHRCQAAMKNLEIEPREAGSLFTLMDSGRGVLSCDELVSGAMRLTGDGKAVDLASIMYENQKSMLVIRSIEQQCNFMVKLAEYTAAKLDDIEVVPQIRSNSNVSEPVRVTLEQEHEGASKPSSMTGVFSM